MKEKPYFSIKHNHNNLSQLLTDWFASTVDIDLSLIEQLQKLMIPNSEDILGVIYQSLLSVGKKSDLGSYYTPSNIVKNIRDDYKFKMDEATDKLLDPCCGTGQFLLDFSECVESPKSLYGYDIDEIAVRIASLNLILKFINQDFIPNISVKNSLVSESVVPLFNQGKENSDKFDLVVTNPPWGYRFQEVVLAILKKQYPNINSQESYSYFLSSALDKTKDDGIVSFILPESILNVKAHRDIRKLILSNNRILKIVSLGKPFKTVFTNVYRIDIQKGRKINNKITIVNENTSYQIDQKQFEDNEDNTFSIFTNPKDSEILDKVFYKGKFYLKENAEWALGIVTGNNKKYVLSEQTTGSEPIYKGKDLKKYTFKNPTNWIVPDFEKFQQVAPTHKYRAKEKLVYKFISKKLSFVYDDQQRLTLNSANIVIPNFKHISTKTVSALLNSSLFQFIFAKKFNSVKILKSHLEALPFPEMESNTNDKLDTLVDNYIESQNTIYLAEIDSEVFKIFDIDEKQKKYIYEQLKG